MNDYNQMDIAEFFNIMIETDEFFEAPRTFTASHMFKLWNTYRTDVIDKVNELTQELK